MYRNELIKPNIDTVTFSKANIINWFRHGLINLEDLARPHLRPARGIRRLDRADRSAAGFSGLANGGTELLLRGKSHGTICLLRRLFHWRVPANVSPFKI